MPKKLLTRSMPKWGIRPLIDDLKQGLYYQSQLLAQWFQKNWFRLLILGLLTLILLRKDVRLQLDLQNGNGNYLTKIRDDLLEVNSENRSVKSLSLMAGQQKQAAYVHRFARIARLEMAQFGIPASITLAQGLLETNAGESPLASRLNNHFGLKCFSRTCKKGHCYNFPDDSHKDFFRNFANAWESFRAHSLLLASSERYASLFQLPKTDYKGWAIGLEEAGYATDRQYAKKLVSLIESLNLHAYDS